MGPRSLRFVIPNAVPLDEIQAARPETLEGLAVRDGQRLVLSVGRFGSEKNVERVFLALREIAKRPDTVCVMCGDGPLRREICRRIERDRLAGRVFAPGYIVDIWPLLKRADVVVGAGMFEGRPNAILEAMAAARPLVVSDIPAHREILDDTSALLVDPRDPGAIAEAVRTVFDDPAAAARRAAAARVRSEAWSIQATAAEYDRVYRIVLALRTPH